MLHRLSYRIVATVAWLAAALTPAGCSKGDTPAPDEAREVTLSFRIATQAPPTRAEIVGEEQGLAAENWIDVERARFLLFTQGGVLLQELQPTHDEATADNFSTYVVTATIREPYFDYAVENGRVRFAIMVLANWPAAALNAVAGRTSVAEIEAAKPLYTMAADYAPAAEAGKGIPMYGYKEFSVAIDDLRRSDETAPVHLDRLPLADNSLNGDINLLRALAKLEVIDNITDRGSDNGTRVTRVELLARSYNLNALLIPAAFRDGVQVTAPTLPADGNTTGTERPFVKQQYTAQQTLNGTTTTFAFDGWTTYLPEMHFPAAAALRITATVSSDYGGGENSYEIPIPNADNVWDGRFLRNHIYRLEVRSVSRDAELTFDYTVCDWDEQRSGKITFD